MKKIVILVLCACICLMSLSACGDGDNGSIKVYMPDGTTAISLSYMMKNHGEINGKKVKYTVVPASTITNYVTTGGGADMVVLPVNAAAKFYKEGAPYTLGAVITHGNLFVVGAEGSASSIQDLGGKKIGCIGFKNIPDMVLNYVLNENGVTAGEIQYRAGSDDVIYDLAEGKIDFGIIAEPEASDLLSKPEISAKNIKTLLNLQDEWAQLQTDWGYEGYPQAGLIIKNSLDRDFALEFLRLSKEGDGWAQDNPAAVAQTIKAHVLKGTASTISANLSAEQIRNCNAKTITDIKDYVEEFFTAINLPIQLDDGFYFTSIHI